jgi:hypothetical protein
MGGRGVREEKTFVLNEDQIRLMRKITIEVVANQCADIADQCTRYGMPLEISERIKRLGAVL